MNKRILDITAGSRMVWFDKKDSRVIFCDKREEEHFLPDKSTKCGIRKLVISPDIQMDFTELLFEDNSFYVVLFDPPHLVKAGSKSWLAKKYGKLTENWETDIEKGFSEAFRVLKQNGILIFKWNETDIPVSKILTLTPNKPLFGNRCGKSSKTHWITFIKDSHEGEI